MGKTDQKEDILDNVQVLCSGCSLHCFCELTAQQFEWK